LFQFDRISKNAGESLLIGARFEGTQLFVLLQVYGIGI